MANISISGTIACKEGSEAVQLKKVGNDLSIGTFSVLDKEWVPGKKDDNQKVGQFYRVEVVGKSAEIAADRLNRGDAVTVHGQLVQSEYNGKTYYTVKNSRLTYFYSGSNESAGSKQAEAVF